jgi:hypothetical protein
MNRGTFDGKNGIDAQPMADIVKTRFPDVLSSDKTDGKQNCPQYNGQPPGEHLCTTYKQRMQETGVPGSEEWHDEAKEEMAVSHSSVSFLVPVSVLHMPVDKRTAN